MRKTIENGTSKTIELKTKIRYKGNWNHKNNGKPIFTKPIGIMVLDGVEFVMGHNEIKELVKLYHDVDVYSMKMILDERVDTREVKRCEQPFLGKLEDFINELNNNDSTPTKKVDEERRVK